MHNKCNVLESSQNHPPPRPPRSVEKLSSTKPFPSAKKLGTTALYGILEKANLLRWETDQWFRGLGWGKSLTIKGQHEGIVWGEGALWTLTVVVDIQIYTWENS